MVLDQVAHTLDDTTAVCGAAQHVQREERVERGNDYCVDVIGRNHVLALFVSLDAVLLGNRLAEVDVCVRAGNYLAALQGVVDAFNVGTADCAGAYQTDSEFFHDIFLLNSC